MVIKLLTVNVLYHTIPHEMCRCEVTVVYGLQSFVTTHFEESDSLRFILCLQYQMLLTSAFLKEISAVSLEEWVLVFKVFTTATNKLRVNVLYHTAQTVAPNRKICSTSITFEGIEFLFYTISASENIYLRIKNQSITAHP